jgi:hypothetical protein
MQATYILQINCPWIKLQMKYSAIKMFYALSTLNDQAIWLRMLGMCESS